MPVQGRPLSSSTIPVGPRGAGFHPPPATPSRQPQPAVLACGMASIVIIEDEKILGRQLRNALATAGHELTLAVSGEAGLKAFDSAEPDLALIDLRLPDQSGLDLITTIRDRFPEVMLIMMTAYGSVSTAVEAMRRGASDYLQKPLDLEDVRQRVELALSRGRTERELEYHRTRAASTPDEVVGSDTRIHAIFEQIDNLASANLEPGRRPTILLTGETGTGKGLVARAIHEALGAGPFIELNCTGLPSSLVEEELFGHERGSFTGAVGSRTGLFEAADGGAIFLDEIGHLEMGVQAKFLKVIEEKRVRRLGASRERALDVHVLAATNRVLSEAVDEGEFRADLFHRLAVLNFEIPPLRDRTADIPLLAGRFCREVGQQYQRSNVRIEDSAMRLLRQYPWPGNVRELRNIIERSILLSRTDSITEDILAPMLLGTKRPKNEFALPEGGIHLAELEANLITQALARAKDNRTQAARLLGLTRDQLRYRMEKFGVS